MVKKKQPPEIDSHKVVIVVYGLSLLFEIFLTLWAVMRKIIDS